MLFLNGSKPMNKFYFIKKLNINLFRFLVIGKNYIDEICLNMNLNTYYDLRITWNKQSSSLVFPINYCINL